MRGRRGGGRRRRKRGRRNDEKEHGKEPEKRYRKKGEENKNLIPMKKQNKRERHNECSDANTWKKKENNTSENPFQANRKRQNRTSNIGKDTSRLQSAWDVLFVFIYPEIQEMAARICNKRNRNSTAGACERPPTNEPEPKRVQSNTTSMIGIGDF